MLNVIVVGAGIAGLACARVLVDAGVPVQVLERDRVPGGRLASRRLDGRPADIGAAYLTVSDPAFAEVVEGWRAAGLAREWTRTFQVYQGEARGQVSAPAVGPMRWAAPGGLRCLAERLASGLPVTYGHPVEHVRPDAAGVLLDGAPARAVVLAMPAPQAARLYSPAGDVADAQAWQPVLAAVLRYPVRSWPDFAGAFVNAHPVLVNVCDDGDRRGDRAPVLVAHSTGDVARRYLADPQGAAKPMAGAVRDLLGLPTAPDDVVVHRWTFARPAISGSPARAWKTSPTGEVLLAGDAYGEPRVQTAWLSGRAAGEELLRRYGRGRHA